MDCVALRKVMRLPRRELKLLHNLEQPLTAMLDMKVPRDTRYEHASCLLDLLVLYATVSDENRRAVEALLMYPLSGMRKRLFQYPFKRDKYMSTTWTYETRHQNPFKGAKSKEVAPPKAEKAVRKSESPLLPTKTARREKTSIKEEPRSRPVTRSMKKLG